MERHEEVKSFLATYMPNDGDVGFGYREYDEPPLWWRVLGWDVELLWFGTVSSEAWSVEGIQNLAVYVDRNDGVVYLAHGNKKEWKDRVYRLMTLTSPVSRVNVTAHFELAAGTIIRVFDQDAHAVATLAYTTDEELVS